MMDPTDATNAPVGASDAYDVLVVGGNQAQERHMNTSPTPARVSLATSHEGRSPMSALQPTLLLRAEGAMLLVAAATLYWKEDASWLLFAVAFFLPDLAMVGYLAGNRIGAAAYNAVHAAVLPVVLGVIGVVTDGSLLITVALVWIAHIGFDRVLGYGLKYADGFKETHLART